jgi:glycerol uptake facilitator-like aquaporin
VHPISLARRLIAEGLGTAFLLAAIVGSGIMAEWLAGGNEALALLCNSTATGAMLVVLVTVFGPISGAHLNPAVTLVVAMRREIALAVAGTYVLSQLVGATIGTWSAHLMFESILQLSTKARDSPALWFAGGRSDLRFDLDHPRHAPVESRLGPFHGGPLHRFGLLVHGLDQLR